MKKIALYLTILVSMVFYVSCDLNDYPTFDDKNAFVGFETERVSAKEDADSIVIPVRLTSLKGISATVTFEIIDGTAVQGVDFDLRGGASVLTFGGSAPVRDIKFDIIPQIGVFTGDLMFSVAIKTVTGADKGSNDTIYVTIQDIDHPLSEILGAYTGSGDDAWGDGIYSWDGVEFAKDADDVSKVWINRVLETGGNVYGIVNEDKTEISVPVHQSVGKISGYNAYFEGAEIPFAMMEDGQKLTFKIDGGVISLVGDYQAGLGAYNPNTDAFAGWFERVSKLTFTKK